MAKALKSETFEPEWGRLRAQNRVSYAGTSLEFRRQNPRNFAFKGAKHKDIVLIDDIVTTGTTLTEAKNVAAIAGYDALFAITLADAKE